MSMLDVTKFSKALPADVYKRQGEIIHLLMEDLNSRLVDKEVRVELSKEAEAYVVDHGCDPVYGARPVSYTHLDVYKRQELTDKINSVLKEMTTEEFDSMMDEAISVKPLSE